jgi:hypothetical protein
MEIKDAGYLKMVRYIMRESIVCNGFAKKAGKVAA